MIKEMHGDIFHLLDTGVVQAIAHGCNGIGVMGAGVAYDVQLRWPRLLKGYQEFCKNGMFADVRVHVYEIPEGELNAGRIIANLYTQPRPGKCAELQLILAAVQKLDWILTETEVYDVKSVAMPWIGAGLGGLKWPDVRDALRLALEASPIEYLLVEYWPYSGKNGLDKSI